MIRLLMKNIAGFIKNKLIFALFSIGLVVTLTAVFFLYNVNANINASDPDAQSKYQVATIDLTGLTKEQVNEAYEQFSSQRKDILFAFSIFQDNGNMIAASHSHTPYLYFGRYFTSKDMTDGTAVAIVSKSLYEEYHDHSQIRIKGQPYEILAYSDRAFTEVPFHSLAQDVELDAMQVFFKKMLSKSMVDALGEQLAGAFPTSLVKLPSAPDIQAVSKNLYQSYLSILIVIVALLNLSFLYRYILNKREKKYGVYRICGCSTGKGFLLYFTEIMVITSAFYLLTAILFHFGIERLLPLMNDTLGYTLFLADYLVFYAVFIVLVSLIFIPAIIKFNQKRPIDLLK